MSARLRDILLILRHELRSTFRDRNTLIYAVALPIVLYPAIFLVVVQLLQLQGRLERAAPLRVALAAPERVLGWEDPESGLELAEFRAALAAQLPRGPEGEARAVEWKHASLEEARREWKGDGARAALERHGVELLLHVERDSSSAAWRAQAHHDPLALEARGAASAWAGAWNALRDERRVAAYAAAGGTAAAFEVLAWSEVDATPPVNRGNRLPALLIPMILIIMGTIGAFYPAIDATAGERERGTAETTAVLPLPRTYLATGKYLAVLTSALLAFALNLLSMWLTWPLLRASLAGGVEAWNLSLLQIALLFAIGGLFLSFVSALLLSVAVYARTFKEGQAFLGPLYSLCLLPAMVAAVPGFELDQRTACVPFLNAALALRAIFEGHAEQHLPALLQTGGVCLLLTGLCLMLVARSYLSEETLIGGDSGGFWVRWKAARSARLPGARRTR
ncbi:MAG: ABC transporter permease subunit [Planctomycetes bacterium]|nr:ABC transporter permease subunit [Planctomycetota bacterium]